MEAQKLKARAESWRCVHRGRTGRRNIEMHASTVVSARSLTVVRNVVVKKQSC